MASDKPHRPVRSFVLRGGRLTSGQQKAFDRYWPLFGVDFAAQQQLDFPRLFGNDNPVWLEIGFGNGESLAGMAARHPQRNWLGIEVHPPGVGHLLLKLAENGLENVRIIRHDAMEVLRQAIPPASLSGVQLFFPDPWHKKRHLKRRIVQPAFIELIARALQQGGGFHAATDWEDYAHHILEAFSQRNDLFENLAGAGRFATRPTERPLTKFERRGQQLGHQVWDLMFRRTSGQ